MIELTDTNAGAIAGEFTRARTRAGSPVMGIVPCDARYTSTAPMRPCRSWLNADELSERSSWGAP